jgi:hypothetical protein
MNDDTRDETNSDGFFDRIKESPRTVSALIIILIVAAAIYAFSGEPTQPQAGDDAGIDTTAGLFDTNDDADEENEEMAEETAAMTPAPAASPVASREAIPQQKLQEMGQSLPQGERQGNAYVEKAQAGDGLTHLARRASTRWLADNQAGYAVTNEHRIYIEDYIQNKLGTDRLSVDESRTISFDLIAEAVQSAGQLNDQQLHNLSGYTTVLQ